VVTEITLFEIPPSTCTATHPDLSKKYPLGAGFRRLSTSPQRQASAQPEPPGVVRRSAEKTTHLARRRGGGRRRAQEADSVLPLVIPRTDDVVRMSHPYWTAATQTAFSKGGDLQTQQNRKGSR